ncbi:ankyrin protein 3 [Fusarium denticulatum]|uniref:Ankyrin protein 3 n=1 Tax=Fusarium denticulatum TaxID=48507 RepID=A0A8H5X595_9HYPO|nr:ankyrin protein 3 [Fusarium denticulatum]
MERRRLSHSDDGALPYHAKRRRTGFQQIEDDSIRERYTVAWICALHIEMAAARAMLDQEHSEYPQQGNDTNSYVLGSIRNHNVAIACLPEAQYGLNNAASVLSNMRRTFPNIEIGLMCDLSKLETRKQRLSTDPVIYYGGIGSANTVMKDSVIRDGIARELDVLCFEMEAAGLMDIMPCLPIRGICDYSDSHKSKEWQRYAAATAAAYAYEFLEVWRGDSQESHVGYSQGQNESFVTSERHQEILNSLDFEQIDARKLIIKAAHSKTCRWFLKHPDYLSWIDRQKISHHHGFLWIRGKPGAGKSTIMKFIYQESKKKDRKHQTLTASFFFNARGEVLEKTVSGMYRSLLLQLFHGFPDIECVLDDPELLPRNQSGCPPLNALKDLLRAAVAKLGQRSFRCFIDALDECDEQQVMDLVEYFEDLAEKCSEDNVDLRICFSSRHYPYIDIKFGIRIVLEEELGHGGDLESYIKSNLRIKDGPLLAEFQEKMLEKAAGVFLWVVLVVDIMNKENCRGRLAMRTRLEQVPSGLSDLFKDLLKRDKSNMEELQLSLLWILLSERPLKPDEYYHAIWSGLYLEGLADLDIPEVDTEDSEDCFARCVISSSKGLAEITKVKQPRVQFIHESVRDFLVKDKGLHELWPELGPDWESVGHDRLKMCCYSYVEFVLEKEQLEVEDYNSFELRVTTEAQAYPFLEYASQFVLRHSDFAANTANQQKFLENFRTSAWKGVVNTFEKFRVRKYSPTAGLLYILADRGHSSLIRTRLESDTTFNTPSKADRYVYPLIAAMAKGDKASVLALLRLPSALYEGMDIAEGLLPNIDAGGVGRTPLSWACENGHFRIARVLVERDNQPIDVDEPASSPLMLASKNGHIDIARWLVNRDAHIHREYRKESAIWLASSNGHTEVVELLLNSGADINTRGVNGTPIIFPAVEKGYEKVVKLLLERKANVQAEPNQGRTPLHFAARKEGSRATMQVLLSYGADINAMDDQRRTPLIVAVRHASIDEIGFLIRQGADATAQDKRGATCLHTAMERDKATLDIVRLLLENGATADARDGNGQTCLHALARRGTIPYNSDLIQLVTSHGTGINAHDDAGDTPLHLVTRFGTLEALSSFSDQLGLDLNARNHLGKTPLHVAASLRVQRTGELDILIRKGADINALDNESRTPLDDATERGYEPSIQLLIENGGKRGAT